MSYPTTWPEWAVTEDSDMVWVRHDAGPEVLAEAKSCVEEPGWSMLAFRGTVTMTRGVAGLGEDAYLNACSWSDQPLIQETDDEHDPQEAMRYRYFEVVECDPTNDPTKEDVPSVCAACGESVSYTDEDGCVGTLPTAYHMRAICLLEACRRENARVEVLREAAEEAIRLMEDAPGGRKSPAQLLEARVVLRAALNAL